MTLPPISIGLIHFRSCTAEHFAAALTSVLAQDLTGVSEILVYDNDSGTSAEELVEAATKVYPSWRTTTPRPRWVFDRHGDPTRTHPYSVNATLDQLAGPLVFLTRSDYILAPDALTQMRALLLHFLMAHQKPFVSGWCFQTAYDRQEQPYPSYDPACLLGRPFETNIETLPGFMFTETDQDAGVWLTFKAYWEACRLNEQLHAWGYAQSTWQRELRAQGVTTATVPRCLFLHQQHGAWTRDHAVARAQYEQYGGGR